MCEFAINSSYQSSTCKTPFLSYGFNPQSPSDLLVQSEQSDWIKDRNDALRIAKYAIVATQARQQLLEVYADCGRMAGDINVGDVVLVHRDFLTTAEARDQPSHKLRPKWFGPFAVLQTIGTNAYRLYLPSIIRCHSVFSVAVLRKYQYINSIPDRRQPPPPPITDLDGNTRYMVEKILDDRI